MKTGDFDVEYIVFRIADSISWGKITLENQWGRVENE